jgi:hypothetical protein
MLVSLLLASFHKLLKQAKPNGFLPGVELAPEFSGAFFMLVGALSRNISRLPYIVSIDTLMSRFDKKFLSKSLVH